MIQHIGFRFYLERGRKSDIKGCPLVTYKNVLKPITGVG